ncbi:DeoR/GlpR family DNA-binding transcription regulator [Pseudonocardia sp.]|jgi:DeoR/GlpR family transcriptional regulator of sugar metabolism|uniref:DeoR/GlpR family DNA-binding transcription regulator n=1 Tax=Pseudonocardia sp. TaxID=60912 RepID=UPI0031FCC7B8
MKASVRRSQILQELAEAGSVTVVDLAERFSVSPMTIRRDLLELERAALVRRVHGGAVAGRGRSYEPPLLLRTGENADVKRRIGALAASMIAEGDSVALDTGSTCLEVACNLRGRRNLTVLTPGFRIAEILIDEPDIRLILTGGIVRPGEASLIGDLARHAFQELSVDRLVLAVGGVDAAFGLSEYNWDDVLVKQAMIRSAKEVILVADSRKFDQIAFARIAGLEAVAMLVTDREPGEPLRAALKSAGVKTLIAPAAS